MRVTIPCEVLYADGSTPGSTEWKFVLDDPIAVTVIFRNAAVDGEDVEWVFARALIVDALNPKIGMAGMGDVRFHLKGTVLRMMVESQEGSASVEFDALLVAGFLSRTNMLCLSAETYEQEAYDFDAIVLELLKEA